VALAAVVVLVILWRTSSSSLDKVVDRAAKEGNVAGVVAAIARVSGDHQPTLYNHAIRRLWDAYERERATELVKELARQHHNTPIAQYWLKQVAQAEPALATGILTKAFFDNHYLPEVASRCGPVG
jgi:ABC-type phosphate transport system permease subunit